MTNGRWTLLTALLLIVTAGLWSNLSQPASGQSGEASHARFQLATAASHGATHVVVVLDTITGEVWTRPADGNTDWLSLGSPKRKP